MYRVKESAVGCPVFAHPIQAAVLSLPVPQCGGHFIACLS